MAHTIRKVRRLYAEWGWWAKNTTVTFN